MLHEITSKWNHDELLELYKHDSNVILDVGKYFYYNQSTLRVETINVNDEGKRYIIPIMLDNETKYIMDLIPTYTNVFLTSNELLEVFIGKEGIVEYNDLSYLIVNANIKHNIEFGLYNIDTCWDIYGTLIQYKNGNYTIEQMSYWFYYNTSSIQVETINVNENGNRYIVPIDELKDMATILPKYANVFLDNVPKSFIDREGIVEYNDNKYIIVQKNSNIEENDECSNMYSSILEYIRSMPYCTVDDIRTIWYNINGKMGYKKLLTYLTNNSIKLLEVTGKIKLGQLIKSSVYVKGSSNEQTCYFYYSGILPQNVRIPKYYTNKI